MDSNPSGSSSSSSRVDRKTMEKNRRHEMKSLFNELNSLVPHQQGSSLRGCMPLSNRLENTIEYIKELQAKLERLEEKKNNLLIRKDHQPDETTTISSSSGTSRLKTPQIEVHARGNSALEVVLITGLDCYTIFNESIRVIRDEGVEIVNASFSVVDDFAVHTIHAKIEASARCQEAVERITEKLNKLCVDS